LGCSSSSKSTPIVDAPYSGPDGAIRGVVVMPDGSTLPGVIVVLHTPHGDVTRVTDAQGRYEFINVAPGVYRLSAELSGFGRREIKITVRQGVAIGVTMTLNAAVSESITVTAETPRLTPNVISASMNSASSSRRVAAQVIYERPAT